MKFILFCLLFSFPLFSADIPTESEAEFKLDKDLVNRMYDESLTQQDRMPSTYSAGLTVAPLISFFSPSKMTLENDYFSVPYADGMGGGLGLNVSATKNLYSLGNLYISAWGGAGYSFKEGVQNAYQKKAPPGYQKRTARITLHRLPIALGAKLEYVIPGFSSVRPFAGAKAGRQWLYQTAEKMDGIEQGFWIPYYEFGGGLVLFDTPSSLDKWFGGVVLSLTKQQSFSSTQEIAGWSFDLGVNILL